MKFGWYHKAKRYTSRADIRSKSRSLCWKSQWFKSTLRKLHILIVGGVQMCLILKSYCIELFGHLFRSLIKIVLSRNPHALHRQKAYYANMSGIIKQDWMRACNTKTCFGTYVPSYRTHPRARAWSNRCQNKSMINTNTIAREKSKRWNKKCVRTYAAESEHPFVHSATSLCDDLSHLQCNAQQKVELWVCTNMCYDRGMGAGGGGRGIRETIVTPL